MAWYKFGLGMYLLSFITLRIKDSVLSIPRIGIWISQLMERMGEKMYDVDPLDFKLSDPSLKELIFGGEASLWTEFVNSNTLCSILWPRASPIGERLWTYKSSPRDTMKSRLQEHECRLLRRGYPVQPLNGPGFFWNEVFDNKNNVTKDTLIHIWVGNYTSKVNEVTKAGLQVIMSEGWYLNYISYGSDWNNQYKIDPQRFNGTEAQKRLVVGGEACMWGEFVNNRNLSPRLWPRASSIGERLWSSVLVNDTKKASPRIQEMQCRLIQRGYDVEPIIGPGFLSLYL
ncbi:HEXA_B [Lepeophtheirus salmonis]|uniref:beta-N-acetylhexosaminidase n=1 Tax=Lepeophtheirus salmonis TaxID=72036 RepID=A0A7R8H7N6_LEPSM|nr:HEXA_B [Lepeophtheirus salmonis]CAF2924435.1 HEXA_B [Lepeophtheirus salmonis]